ncbi:hypothetical protein [Dechloromonas denitrificans]|uniref:hypothetical protein n=1 Tax=Dechloromonas denitrificans TaxID=281362 RepID=UPI001CF8F696|nr:hypothetical protein [Dechloromonas denitrificans]UCV01737.1 hypothetical protein KI611_11445 [Dechloromonas denitrificans]
MSVLLKRIEKLEAANRPPLELEPMRIIRMIVDPKAGPTSALCGGQQINRQAGETDSAFRERASREFNRAFNGPCVESVDGDEKI